MPTALWRDVSSTVAARAPTCRTMVVISDSGIGPGPLGMADTRPSMSAPAPIARSASSVVAMQHTFTRRTPSRVRSSAARASAATCTAGDTDGLCTEIGEEAAHERSMQVLGAQDAAAPHAHAALDQIPAPAALIAVREDLRAPEELDLRHAG